MDWKPFSGTLHDFFEVTPRIFRSGRPVTVTIRGRYAQRNFAAMSKNGRFEVDWIPAGGLLADGAVPEYNIYNTQQVFCAEAEPETLVIGLPPQEEGELFVRLYFLCDGKREEICSFGIYILAEDLFQLRPYRGDLHLHSSFSECCSRLEDVHYVAATARKHGLDFIVVTDHLQREASVEAGKFIQSLETDFQVFPGEECHLVDHRAESLFCRNIFFTGVHIVSIGARTGICKWINEHYEEFRSEVEAIAGTLKLTGNEKLRFETAGADWLFDKIREFGGVSLFCHPFWRPAHRNNLPDSVREHIFQQGKYDVLEVQGMGAVYDSTYVFGNELCRNRWAEECVRRGKLIPVAGTSDSHNSEQLLGRQFTLVFACSSSFEALADALKAGNCVAAGRSDGETGWRLIGSSRLTAYAHWLLEEFYPWHDAMCRTEGEAMLARLRGETGSAELPFGGHLSGNLFQKFFDR